VEALDPDLVPEICGPAERAWLASLPAERQGVLARAVFSAKESAYKCQYPLSRQLLDFQALDIEIDPAESRFTARFTVDAAPFRAGDSLHGRLAIADGHIATATMLGHRDIAARPEWLAGSLS
jgi:4'-phosphopantetheinyl transferase EntD